VIHKPKNLSYTNILEVPMTRICLLQNHVEVIAESRGLSRCDLFLKNMMLSALLSDNLFPWLGNEFASKLRRQSELI
jgi:hypothetical protein